jgi:geranylgeranyl diphosphate synthase type II
MSDKLAEFFGLYGPGLEKSLLRCLPLSDKPGTELFNNAVYYSVFPGGKRIRPLFTLLAADVAGGDPEQAFSTACAVEYFHTCSLIFDDLPSMDNAGARRGQQPTHSAFGESTAILAALALFNQGYALIGQTSPQVKRSGIVRRLMEETAACIGANGMIGGQIVDLLPETANNPQLRSISYLKTTPLMRLMLTGGAITVGAEESLINSMAVFGENLGEVYQMVDDIIDKVEDNYDKASPDRAIDCPILSKQAAKKLNRSCDSFLENMEDKNPVLMIEFADRIFSGLIKKASSLIGTGKYHWEAIMEETRSLKTERL